MAIIIIALFWLGILVAIPYCVATKGNDEPPQEKARKPNDDWLTPLYNITDEDAAEMEISQDMADWLDMEEACEGKTIRTLSCNEAGIIIRFTDGSVFKQINGITEYEERV